MSYDNPGSIRKSSMPLLLSSYEKSYDNVTWITPTKIPTKNLAKCPTWIAKVRTNNHYRKNFRRCLRSWREYQIFVRSRIFVRKFLRKLSTWIRPQALYRLHSRLRRKKSKSKFWNAWRQFLCYRLCWTWWYHLFQNLRSFSWPLSCLKSSFLTLRGQIVFYPITLLQKSDTTTRLVSLWSARQGKSTDTRFCLFWPYMTLRSRDLRSNFDLGLSGSKHTSFDSSRREKHNGVRYFALDRSIQKLSAKNHMVIFSHWPDLWRHQMTENFKIGYQRRPFITANTLVSVPSHYLN